MVNVEHQHLLPLIPNQKSDIFIIIFILKCNKNTILSLEFYNEEELGLAVPLTIRLTLSAYTVHVGIHN